MPANPSTMGTPSFGQRTFPGLKFDRRGNRNRELRKIANLPDFYKIHILLCQHSKRKKYSTENVNVFFLREQF